MPFLIIAILRLDVAVVACILPLTQNIRFLGLSDWKVILLFAIVNFCPAEFVLAKLIFVQVLLVNHCVAVLSTRFILAIGFLSASHILEIISILASLWSVKLNQ